MQCQTCKTDMALGQNSIKKWFFCRSCGYYVELVHLGDNGYARAIPKNAGQIREVNVHARCEDEGGADIQQDPPQGE